MSRPARSLPQRALALSLALSTALVVPGSAVAAEGSYGPLALQPKDAEIIEKCGEIEELFRRRGDVLPDGPDVELVRRIGAAVAPAHPSDPYVHYRFGIVRSPVPNAFALPDGQVYVHEGLLALLQNEAQLAAVLAHEVMHVEGHHSILNARQARKKQGGMLALSILLGDVGQLINIALMHAIIGYGRDLEEEADVRGLPRVLEAGYDPREMPRIFELLDEDPEGEQMPVKPAWADHPLGVQRTATANALLAKMAPEIQTAEQEHGPLRVGDEGFAALTARSAHDAIEATLRADRPRTALQLARRLADRRPGDPDVLALLGDSWRGLDARAPEVPADARTKKEIRHRIQQRQKMTREEREALRKNDPTALPILEANWENAIEAYLDALAIDPDHPAALRGLGLVLYQQDELVPAGRRLARYVEVAPNALDRTAILRTLTDITARLKASPPSAEPETVLPAASPDRAPPATAPEGTPESIPESHP